MIETALSWEIGSLKNLVLFPFLTIDTLRKLAEWAKCAVVINKHTGTYMLAPLKFDEQDRVALEQGTHRKALTLTVSKSGKTLLSAIVGGTYKGDFSRCDDETVLPPWITNLKIQA